MYIFDKKTVGQCMPAIHRSLLEALHTCLAGALIIIPFWTAAYEPVAFFIQVLTKIALPPANMEAALSRLLLLAWILAFIAIKVPFRTACMFRTARDSVGSVAVSAVAVGLIMLFVVLYYVEGNNPFFYSLRSDSAEIPLIYREDGVMETAGAAGFILGGIVLFLAGVRVRRLMPALSAVIFLLAFTGLVVGGEEISWGQRLFGWQSQGVFADSNIQQETNLHNFLDRYRVTHLTALIIALMAACSAYADRLVRFIPITGLESLFPGAGVRLSLILLPIITAVVADAELTEELLAWLFFCYGLQQLGRNRSSQAAVAQWKSTSLTGQTDGTGAGPYRR